jgi:hypothetical protein
MVFKFSLILMNYTCKHCGSDSTKIEKGKPPHLASLICADCDRWIKWLSKRELASIEQSERDRARQDDRADMLNLYGWRD